MEDFLANTILKGLAKKALAGLFLKMPFLAWGPIGWFVTMITDRYIGLLIEEMGKHFDIKEVFAKNDGLRKEHDKAGIKLKIVALNYGENSKEFEKERLNAEEKLADFIMLDIAS